MKKSMQPSAGPTLDRCLNAAVRLLQRVLSLTAGKKLSAKVLLVFLTGYARIIEQGVAIIHGNLGVMTRNRRREELVPRLPELQRLSLDVNTASKYLDQYAAGAAWDPVNYPLGHFETAFGWLNGAREQIKRLVFGRLDIWIRNPERALLEGLRQSILAREPDSEDYLSWYAHRIGLPSELRFRDALALAVCRENWRHQDIKGRERAYFLRTAMAIEAGSDGSKLLTTRFSELDADTNGEVELTVLAPQRIEIELPTRTPPGLSDDDMVVLHARREGLTFEQMSGALSLKTGEPWSEKRVQAAKRRILRKKPLLQGLVTTNQVYSGTRSMKEQLASGRRIWSHEAPDPETLSIIRDSLPFPHQK